MRTSRLTATAALTVGLVGLAGAPALASGASDPYDCPDFDSQAQAQAEFDRVGGDPSGLDSDDDGEACEDTDYASSGADSSDDDDESSSSQDDDESSSSQDDDEMAMPAGGVDAGAGGTAGDVSGLLLSGGLLAAAGAGGIVLVRRRNAA